jgi:exodeoxyribonuclease VII small subunit
MGYFAGSRPNARHERQARESRPARELRARARGLEKIVATMESGKLTLEQSLAAHKRGLRAQYCQGVLARPSNR